MGVFWASSFIPYHQHFKEGQLQHTTNILFLAARPRKWVFIVIGPVSLTGSHGGGTSQKEECGPNFMFPIFDCCLNKWVKGRWGERQANRPRRLTHASQQRLAHKDMCETRTWHPNNLKAKWNLNVCLPPSSQQTRYTRCNIINKAWRPEAYVCHGLHAYMCVWTSKVIKAEVNKRWMRG